MKSMLLWAAAALSNAACAATVYDNGSFYDLAGSFDNSMAADDFKLSQDTVLAGASFFAFGDRGTYTAWDGTTDYVIFADSGSAPGAVLASGKVSPVRTIVHDWGPPYREQFRFDFDFDAPFTASAGSVYWLGLHMGSSYSGSYIRWFWNYTAAFDSGGNSMYSAFGTLDNWVVGSHNERAFYLNGTAVTTVPEPSPRLLLLVAGPVLLGASRLKASAEARRVQYALLRGTSSQAA